MTENIIKDIVIYYPCPVCDRSIPEEAVGCPYCCSIFVPVEQEAEHPIIAELKRRGCEVIEDDPFFVSKMTTNGRD